MKKVIVLFKKKQIFNFASSVLFLQFVTKSRFLQVTYHFAGVVGTRNLTIPRFISELILRALTLVIFKSVFDVLLVNV